jgi:HK97 family phage major capsid protein
MELTELKSELEGIKSTLEAKLDKALAEHASQIEKQGKASTELTGKIDEMSQKHQETHDQLVELAQKQAKGFSQETKGDKSLGHAFMKSDRVQDFLIRGEGSVKVEVKNTIIGEGGSPQDPVDTIVRPDRLAGIIPGAFRSLNILDVIPMGSTSSNQVEYTQEDTFVNNAAERAESTGKPETDVTFKLVQEPVRTVAHFIKLSKQVLDDAPALRSYVDSRMVHGVRRRLQFQILRGNGTSPNMAGLSASGRHTAFTPVTGDTELDSINRAKYAVIGADFEANAVLVNPSDWGKIERSKVTGGGYVLGDGAAMNYIAGGMVPTVWGLPVIPSNDVEAGKFYVLDLNAIQLFMREGVSVEMGFVNDDFTNNLFTLRAELRGALAVFQPTAVRYGDLVV